VCFIGADPEVTKLHLYLGPGQRGRAVECHGIVMLVHKVENFAAGGGD